MIILLLFFLLAASSCRSTPVVSTEPLLNYSPSQFTCEDEFIFVGRPIILYGNVSCPEINGFGNAFPGIQFQNDVDGMIDFPYSGGNYTIVFWISGISANVHFHAGSLSIFYEYGSDTIKFSVGDFIQQPYLDPQMLLAMKPGSAISISILPTYTNCLDIYINGIVSRDNCFNGNSFSLDEQNIRIESGTILSSLMIWPYILTDIEGGEDILLNASTVFPTPIETVIKDVTLLLFDNETSSLIDLPYYRLVVNSTEDIREEAFYIVESTSNLTTEDGQLVVVNDTVTASVVYTHPSVYNVSYTTSGCEVVDVFTYRLVNSSSVGTIRICIIDVPEKPVSSDKDVLNVRNGDKRIFSLPSVSGETQYDPNSQYNVISFDSQTGYNPELYVEFFPSFTGLFGKLYDSTCLYEIKETTVLNSTRYLMFPPFTFCYYNNERSVTQGGLDEFTYRFIHYDNVRSDTYTLTVHVSSAFSCPSERINEDTGTFIDLTSSLPNYYEGPCVSSGHEISAGSEDANNITILLPRIEVETNFTIHSLPLGGKLYEVNGSEIQIGFVLVSTPYLTYVPNTNYFNRKPVTGYLEVSSCAIKEFPGCPDTFNFSRVSPNGETTNQDLFPYTIYVNSRFSELQAPRIDTKITHILGKKTTLGISVAASDLDDNEFRIGMSVIPPHGMAIGGYLKTSNFTTCVNIFATKSSGGCSEALIIYETPLNLDKISEDMYLYSLEDTGIYTSSVIVNFFKYPSFTTGFYDPDFAITYTPSLTKVINISTIKVDGVSLSGENGEEDTTLSSFIYGLLILMLSPLALGLLVLTYMCIVLTRKNSQVLRRKEIKQGQLYDDIEELKEILEKENTK